MTLVVLRHAKTGSPLARIRDETARHRCMDVIGSLLANSGGHGARVQMGKRVIQYGAIALCHAYGLRLTAAFLSGLAGAILAEADREAA